MIVILVFCILAIIIFVLAALKQSQTHRKSIETFNEEMYYDMTKYEKEVYYDIIDVFKEVLSRHPTIDELFSEFKNIKNRKYYITDLRDQLIKSLENENISKGSQYMEQQAPVDIEPKYKVDVEEEQYVDEEDNDDHSEEYIIADANTPIDMNQKPVPFAITRPNIHDRRSLVLHEKIEKSKKCDNLKLSIDNTRHPLARLQHDRNMDQLKFHCAKET